MGHVWISMMLIHFTVSFIAQMSSTTIFLSGVLIKKSRGRKTPGRGLLLNMAELLWLLLFSFKNNVLCNHCNVSYMQQLLPLCSASLNDQIKAFFLP